MTSTGNRGVAYYQCLDQHSGTALIEPATQQQVSYAELEQRVSACVDRIHERVNDDVPVLMALPFGRDIESVIGYLALLRANIPTLLIDPQLAETEKQSLFQSLEVCYEMNGGQPLPTGVGPTAHLDTKANKGVLPALLLSTSGSSGNPKSVMLSLANLVANTRQILGFLPITSDDCAITTLPLHYSYGLSVLNTHLAVGAKVVLTDTPLMSRDFWQLMKAHGVTSFSGVPFHYEMLKMLRFERMKLPVLRYLTQAGGKLSGERVKEFARLAKQNSWQFFVMYGQTEATARMGYMPPERIADYPDCIGQAIPGGAFEIHSVETGQLISEANQEGELWYYGENVMLGYAEQASDWQSSVLPQNALATGDLAIWDESGWIKITGRLSRFIKIRGNRMQLDHVERQLQKLEPQILCCGKDEMLFVINAKNEAEVTLYLRGRLHLHPSLFSLLQIDPLPVLTNGKLDHQALLQRCESEV
jgi:acyl-CoA synthetase (AMP-forming)/AMP-acid ligase II